MTCIVAIETPEGAWIGADSLTSAGWTVEAVAGGKLCEPVPGLIAAVAGEIRHANIVRHRWRPSPPAIGQEFDAWLYDAVESLREAVKASGSAWTDNGQENTSGGHSSVLLVAGGRVAYVGTNFAIWRPASGYAAAGSGEAHALGALYTTARLPIPAEDRVRLALAAAEAHAPGVRAPFDVRWQPRP